jgi:AcrR family transcriptional regulator
MTPDTMSLRARDRIHEVDEAAREVIVRKGLAATTMRDISRQGGFTTGVLTHYFPDKEALIVGVFASASRDWIERVRTALAATATARERVIEVVSLAIPEDRAERRSWRLWSEMWSYASGNPSFAQYVIKTDAIWEEELREVLRQSVIDGLLPAELDAEVHARLLCRLVDGLGQRCVLSGRWREARRTLIAHLAAIGLAEDLVRELYERAPAR